jgi:hypothetical protein
LALTHDPYEISFLTELGCTFLGDWKKELLQKSEYLPAQYWRYVDDIWGIWEHGLDKRHQFPNLANSALTSKQNMIAPFGKGC